MSVTQDASSVQVALSVVISSSSPSESLTPDSGIDPLVPGSGDSGLVPDLSFSMESF